MPREKIEPIRDPVLPRLAYTIPEFCDAARISRSLYYRLRQQGHVPQEMEIGGRRLISISEALAWVNLMTEETAAADAKQANP